MRDWTSPIIYIRRNQIPGVVLVEGCKPYEDVKRKHKDGCLFREIKYFTLRGVFSIPLGLLSDRPASKSSIPQPSN